MNNVTLSGVVVSEPRVVSAKLIVLRVAAGTKDSPLYIDVKAVGRSYNLAQSLHKGDPVVVSGQLVMDTWKGRDGSNRSRIGILSSSLEKVVKYSRRNSQPPQQQVPQPQQQQAPQYQQPDPQDYEPFNPLGADFV